MTEDHTSTKMNNNYFAAICSFMLSHPLHFSYFIFFSPYLFKLISFLSPLFVTTFLLFISLLTTFIPSKSEEGFLLTAYYTLFEKLRHGFEDGGEKSQPVEEFEVYKIVFETTPVVEAMEQYPDERIIFEEIPVGFSEKKSDPEEIKLEDKCESLTTGDETGEAKTGRVKEEVRKLESILSKDIFVENEMSINKELKIKEGSLRLENEKKISEAFHRTVGNFPYLGSFGSMRREREWRRTLACKLFEERHNGGLANVGGKNSEEGMDLLWETYETESITSMAEEKNNRKSRRVKNQGFMVVKEEKEKEDDDDDGDGDGDHVKICCLQALKLSAGKMNLSMGRPSLIKFGKAFKGMGWLHKSPAKKQGKKGY